MDVPRCSNGCAGLHNKENTFYIHNDEMSAISAVVNKSQITPYVVPCTCNYQYLGSSRTTMFDKFRVLHQMPAIPAVVNKSLITPYVLPGTCNYQYLGSSRTTMFDKFRVLHQNSKTSEDNQETNNQVEEKEKEIKKSGVEDLGEDLICSICTEVFIDPYTALDCLHSFCKVCIDEWIKKDKTCPVCRKNIKSCSKSFYFETIILKAVKQMTDEDRKQREELIKQRDYKVAGTSAVPATPLQELAEPQPSRRDQFEWNQRTGPIRRRTRSSTLTPLGEGWYRRNRLLRSLLAATIDLTEEDWPRRNWLLPSLPAEIIDLTHDPDTDIIDLTTP